jgi:hypothetical protein
MAIDRTTENHVYSAIRISRRQAVRWLCRIGIPAVIIASAFCPEGIWIWLLALLVAFQVTKFQGSAVMLAGASGEDRVLAALSALPAEYTLFNQIRLPDERSRTGFREADFVVVGNNGVFIIESKDYRGEIQGDATAPNWELHKIGIGGTPYTKACRNPVRQVQVYVALLSRLFAMRGIKVRITPLVSLSQNNSLAGISSPRVPVMGVDELCGKILAHKGTLSDENRERVIGLLEELRSGAFKEPSDSSIAFPVADCQSIPENNSKSTCLLFHAVR